KKAAAPKKAAAKKPAAKKASKPRTPVIGKNTPVGYDAVRASMKK
ncbi:MAG: histone-like protein 2, partial [Sphingobacteriia bacterium]|nr:histone-like protein 2 [Sphingobacteriia bacterium]